MDWGDPRGQHGPGWRHGLQRPRVCGCSLSPTPPDCIIKPETPDRAQASFSQLSVFQGPQGPQGPIGPPGEMGPKVSAEGLLFVPWCCWGGISSSETTSLGDPGLAWTGGHVLYAAETEGREGRCTLMAYGEELGSQAQGQ